MPSDELDAFLDEIGLNRRILNEVSDETPPVPLDEEKIRAFHRGDLNGPEEYAVAELIAKYAEWRDADWRITEEEFLGDGAFEINRQAIGSAIRQHIEPFRSGQRRISEFDLVAIVRHVENSLIGGRDVAPSLRLQFYEDVAEQVEEALTQRARERLAAEESAADEDGTSDTVALSLETTLVETPSEAKRFLARRQALDEVAEYASDAARYYRLVRFACRSQEEIGEWTGEDVATVRKRFAFADAKLNVAESEAAT